MKNIIILLLAVIVLVVGGLMNLAALIDKPLGLGNLIVSIFILIFLAAYVVLSKTNRKMMLYASIFWSITFVVTISGILGAVLNLTLGIGNILLMAFVGPFFGIRYIIENPVLNLSVLAVIALIFSIISIYTVVRKKSRITPQ